MVGLAQTTEPGVDAVQSGVNVEVSYKEPTTSLGGLPLDDLAYTTIYVVEGEVVIETIEVPAVSVNGGNSINQQVIVDVPRGQIKNLTIIATATDLSGNESDPIDTAIRLDRDPPGQVNKQQ